jgi:hypothetical protein
LPFDLAQGGESFGPAQDRESFGPAQDRESFGPAQDRVPVERLVEPFVMCELVLVIFSLKEGVYTQIYHTTFVTFLWDMTIDVPK